MLRVIGVPGVVAGFSQLHLHFSPVLEHLCIYWLNGGG
jgi:hypothetical protein